MPGGVSISRPRRGALRECTTSRDTPPNAGGPARDARCAGAVPGGGQSVLGVSATLGDMDRGYVANERGRKGRRFAANEMQASTVRAFARQRVQFGTRRAATASISGILARHAIDEALASTRSSRTITPSGLRSCRTWMPQRTPTDHANTISQSPYALLGTRAHYTVGPGGYSRAGWVGHGAACGLR